MGEITGPTLVLVDDESVRSLCFEGLAREGFRAAVVHGAAEALALLAHEEVETFIVELPGPSGEDRMAMLAALRQRVSRPPVSILAVTRMDATAVRRSAIDAGVTDFLTKPIDAIEIGCRVRSLVELGQLRALTRSLQKEVETGTGRCRSIIDSLAVGVATLDAEDRLNLVSRRGAELLGYTADEMLGRPLIDFVKDERGKRLMREQLQRLREGEVLHTEYEVIRKDGAEMWVTTTGTPLFEGGRYAGVAGTSLDITSRHRAEEALRKSEERLSLAIEAAELGLWDWDLSTDTAYLSPQYARLLGLAESEIRSARAWFTDRIHPDDRESRWKTLDEHLQGKTPQSSIEYRARRESGEYVWLRGLGRVVDRNETGTPTRMIGFVIDISEQKQTEEQLHAAIVTRDNVLAIASHDLRNPLSAIHLNATLLTERPPDRERRKNRKQLEMILRSSAHMRRLVDHLLDAATIEAGTFALDGARSELKPLLDDLFEEFEPLAARSSIHLVRDVLGDLPPIWCDPTRLRQVLSNLIGNALKFVPAVGTIAVRVWAQGSDVHFAVSDTGPGIPEEVLDHLFERFWTGDRPGRGNGLGLYISKGIVDAHHGHIFVESSIGVGTTFHFTIPVQPEMEQVLPTVH